MASNFADDTKVARVVADEVRKELKEALDGLCRWAIKWGMEFNVKKCKVMQFGRKNPQV